MSPRDMPSHADPAAEHAAVRGAVGILDRSDFGVIDVTGRDRAAFLHALLSNDVASLAPGQGCRATLLDVHGKVQVLLRLLVLDDRVLVITPPGQAEATEQGLDKYLFSEKAYLSNVTGEYALAMLAGPDAPALAERIAGVRPGETPWSHAGGRIGDAAVRIVRGGAETGLPEVWLISAAADGERVWEAARAEGARPIGRDAYDALRIEAGTAAFPDDMGPAVLLPEVPFGDLVAQNKGCYIGQEVIVRIRDRGHVNRLLRGLLVDGDTVPAPGSPVLAGDTEIGRVTSAAWSYALKRPIALAFVRRPHAAAGTPVTIGSGTATLAASVADLPLVSVAA
jgi:folate-binding protein YgfZ